MRCYHRLARRGVAAMKITDADSELFVSVRFMMILPTSSVSRRAIVQGTDSGATTGRNLPSNFFFLLSTCKPEATPAIGKMNQQMMLL